MASAKNSSRKKRKYGPDRVAKTQANKERKIAKEARRQEKLKARRNGSA